jgi:hypothetical protein
VANSLNLDPEWGSIDLLEEVEGAFDIKITNEEAERCSNVGDLYEVLCTHLPDWDDQDGHCGSSMVFYRLRRSLGRGDKHRVTPHTLLAGIGLPASKLFKKLADDTGLRLPAHSLTWLGNTGVFLLTGGIPAAIVALLNSHWLISGILGLAALAGLPLLRLDPGRFPAGMLTVGDLVRRTVPLNVAILKDAGGRPSDRWSVLVALAAEHGELSLKEIGPETCFHRRSLELASAG